MENMYLKDIMISLIQSIDLVNYLLKNHHKRVAVIAYYIGKSMELSDEQMKRLVVAASLHDIGALYIKERDELIQLDTTYAAEHAIRGKMLLQNLDFFVPVSDIILHHHRHWKNGQGEYFEQKKVPLESFVLHLADRIEILYDPNEYYFNQIDYIINEILNRKGTIFQPDAVDAFIKIKKNEGFWLSLSDFNFENLLREVIHSDHKIEADLMILERITIVFSNIVDYRSQFTATHSTGVGEVAYALARYYGLPIEVCKKLRLAGYLHDIGKIGVPTELIDKPSHLTGNEMEIMKSHAYYTNIILRNIEGMEDICNWASMHHEKRDGSGYPFHKNRNEFSAEVDILIISDIFTALSETRPYREDYSSEEILELLKRETIDISEEVLRVFFREYNKLEMTRINAQKNYMTAFNEKMQSVDTLLKNKEITNFN
ncbi:MAG: HD domain-containing protein [Clostridia bacterium]|nr:HD domain-containing protein [Clostridia bacterium]